MVEVYQKEDALKDDNKKNSSSLHPAIFSCEVFFLKINDSDVTILFYSRWMYQF